MGKKKTVQKNEPWAPAQPYIIKNLQQQDAVFSSTQPQLEQFAKMQRDTYGKLAPGAEAGILASQGLVNDTLGGKYLQGNPYLEGIVGKTRDGIMDRLSSEFSASGRYGSGMHNAVATRELADAENALRFQNYQVERDRQSDAVAQAGGLMNGATGLLNNAAELPWIGVQAANGAVRNASGGYGTTTTTSKPSTLGAIGQGLNIAGNAAMMFSDERLKTDEKKIGERPDGLGVYSYRYKGSDTPQVGVMAQEVERERPDALGPTVGGFKTVDYGALGMPGLVDPNPDRTLEEAEAEFWGPNGPPLARPQTGVPKGLFGAKVPKPKWNEAGGIADKVGQFGEMLMAMDGHPLAIANRQARAAAGDREAEFADWQRREDYRRANERPAPYRFEANNGDQIEIGPDGQQRVLYKDPTPKVTWVEADDGRGGKRLVPFVNGVPATGQAGPQVGAIIDDPRKGGPTPRASGGFR